MTYRLKISKQNQVTLPVALLEEVGADSGDYIQITKRDGALVIETFRDVLKRIRGSVKPKKKRNVNVDIDDQINTSIKKYYSKEPIEV